MLIFSVSFQIDQMSEDEKKHNIVSYIGHANVVLEDSAKCERTGAQGKSGTCGR